MNLKLLLGVLIVGVLVVGYCLYNYSTSQNKEKEVYVYQGPVRPTDNEEHFRRTGETIPLEVKE